MTTYSNSLKLTLIGDGQQAGTWGQTTNTNLGTLLEQAIAGVVQITMTDANYTLTNFNGVSDESRQAVIEVGGANTALRDVIAPAVEKLYVVKNSTTGSQSIRIKTSTGVAVTIPNGMTTTVYCNGTDFFEQKTGTTGNFAVAGNASVTGTTTLTGALSGSTAAFSGAISSVSPSFTGTPTAPTASNGTNTTQIATTAFVLSNGIPSGVIVMWSGSIASIPSGWALCNGTSGTPDLRDRFLVGAGSSYAVGATGGSTDAIVISHTHTFSTTTSSNGDHNHTYNTKSGTAPQSGSATQCWVGDATATTSTAGAHVHSVSGTTASTGSSGTNANLPPYYALAYIMKL